MMQRCPFGAEAAWPTGDIKGFAASKINFGEHEHRKVLVKRTAEERDVGDAEIFAHNDNLPTYALWK